MFYYKFPTWRFNMTNWFDTKTFFWFPHVNSSYIKHCFTEVSVVDYKPHQDVTTPAQRLSRVTINCRSLNTTLYFVTLLCYSTSLLRVFHYIHKRLSYKLVMQLLNTQDLVLSPCG